MQKWYAVAKNEYRLMTSRIRVIRRAIPIILVALPTTAFAIVIYLSNPIYLNNSLMSAVQNYLYIVYGYTSQYQYSFNQVDLTLLMSQLMGILGFLTPIMGSVGAVFRETEVLSQDVVLSSPLRSRDLLFGRFVANLFFIPLYLIIVAALFFPVFIIHGIISTVTPLIIIFAATLPSLVGVWVGVLLSSYIQAKSEGSHHIRDIGRAILGLAGMFLGLSYFILFSSQASSLYWTFSPTTWVTNIIFIAVTGTNWVKITNTFGPYSFPYYLPLQPGLEISLVLLSAFVFLIFLIGILLSTRIFRFEISMGEVKTIEKESRFFKFVRRAIPSPLGAITAVQLKEFLRSMESVVRVASILVFPLIVYFFNFLGFSNNYQPTTSTAGILVLPGFASLYLILTAAFLSIVEASQMTVKQRDVFWNYKKAPRGVENLVYSKLLEMLIIGLPLSLILAVFFQIALGSALSQILTIAPVMLFMTTIGSAIALGIYCARPVFKEQSAGNLINFLIFAVITFFIEGIMVLFAIFPWILNVIFSIPTLSILLSLPSQSSILIFQIPIVIITLAQLNVNTTFSILGIAASAAIGITAAYISLRIGISRLKKFE
ncbi:MAG: hypothetical protein WED07_03395 [Candidatus Freyarchaeum deiterrae]